MAAAPKSAITPVARQTVGEQVAESIRQLVWDGALVPGSRLNQEDLAERLGVSRLPVRDALMALASEGLVQMRPHRGAFLTPLDEEATRDHYALYGLIYGFALRRAASRADDETLASIVAVARQAAATAEPDALQPLMTEFFRAAVQAGGSPRLRAVVKSLTGMVPGNFFVEIPGATEATTAAMDRLAARLAERDADGTADACQTLLEHQGDLVVAAMRRRGLYD